jgi:hypothetical protein
MSLLALPVASLIDDCAIPGGLTIRRAGQATQNQYGGFTPAVSVGILINPIAVHNMTGRDLDQLPEADRNSEAIRVYTKRQVFVQDNNQAADIVEYQSRTWRVTQVLDYSIQGGVYISTATLQDVQQPVP